MVLDARNECFKLPFCDETFKVTENDLNVYEDIIPGMSRGTIKKILKYYIIVRRNVTDSTISITRDVDGSNHETITIADNDVLYGSTLEALNFSSEVISRIKEYLITVLRSLLDSIHSMYENETCIDGTVKFKVDENKNVFAVDVVSNEIMNYGTEYRLAEKEFNNPNLSLNVYFLKEHFLKRLMVEVEKKESVKNMINNLTEMFIKRNTHKFLRNIITNRLNEYEMRMSHVFEHLSKYAVDNPHTTIPNIIQTFYISTTLNYSMHNQNKDIYKYDNTLSLDTIFAVAELYTYHLMKYDKFASAYIDEYLQLFKMHGKLAYRAIDYVETMMSEILSDIDLLEKSKNLNPTSLLVGTSILDDMNYRYKSSIDDNRIHMYVRYALIRTIIIHIPRSWLRKDRYKEVKGYVKLMYKNTLPMNPRAMYTKYCISNTVRRMCAYESGQIFAALNDMLHSHPAQDRLLSKHAWMTHFGRYPKNEAVRILDHEKIKLLKTTNTFKYFMKYINSLNISEYDTHVVLAIANLCISFGSRVYDIIPLHSMSKTDIHNKGVDLAPTKTYSDKEIQWYISSLIYISTHPVNIKYKNLCNVLNNYKSYGLSLNMSLNKLISALKINEYSDVKNISFASECVKHDVDKSSYKDYEEEYLKFKTHESLPQIIVTYGNYKFFKLDYDDPRGLFLGEYTDCCQHINGAGKSCAWHGHQSPQGAFYVVTKKDKIVAQAWAWRKNDDVVFDSIEYLKNSHLDLFEKAASLMIGKLMIKAVKVGMKSGVFEDEKVSSCTSTTCPEDVYSDAKIQHLLAGSVHVTQQR